MSDSDKLQEGDLYTPPPGAKFVIVDTRKDANGDEWIKVKWSDRGIEMECWCPADAFDLTPKVH